MSFEAEYFGVEPTEDECSNNTGNGGEYTVLIEHLEAYYKNIISSRDIKINTLQESEKELTKVIKGHRELIADLEATHKTHIETLNKTHMKRVFKLILLSTLINIVTQELISYGILL